MISVIHPSRGRPEKSARTLQKWISSASGKHRIEFIISLDHDDSELSNYGDTIGTLNMVHELHILNLIIGHNRSAIEAINLAASESKGDVLIVVSDDTDCPEGWDKIIMDDIINFEVLRKGLGVGTVIKYDDGIQKEIVTMPVMDRAFYNRFGYIYNPVYKHAFCDTELTEVAKRTGCLVKKLDILFKHNHYSVTGVTRDAIYERSDAHHDEGKRIFHERKKRNFDL